LDDLPAKTVTVIRDALLRHRVVFFRRQGHLDEAEHQAFARLLGPLVLHPTVPSLAGTEVVHDIDGENRRASRWHTDVTFVPTFPLFSVLRGVVIPPVGGDTVWANAVAAYETAAPSAPRPRRSAVGAPQQRLRLWRNAFQRYGPASTLPRDRVSIDDLRDRTPGGAGASADRGTGDRPRPFRSQAPRRQFGRLRHLFAMLQDHVTQLENTVRWRWSTGDVAIWDNRATQHKAIDDYDNQPRIVRRVTIDGPVSVGIDGRHGKRRDSDAQVTVAA
jgi:alpha-ketoglutarate-dependent sulfate ester dioxygenase